MQGSHFLRLLKILLCGREQDEPAVDAAFELALGYSHHPNSREVAVITAAARKTIPAELAGHYPADFPQYARDRMVAVVDRAALRVRLKLSFVAEKFNLREDAYEGKHQHEPMLNEELRAVFIEFAASICSAFLEEMSSLAALRGSFEIERSYREANEFISVVQTITAKFSRGILDLHPSKSEFIRTYKNIGHSCKDEIAKFIQTLGALRKGPRPLKERDWQCFLSDTEWIELKMCDMRGVAAPHEELSWRACERFLAQPNAEYQRPARAIGNTAQTAGPPTLNRDRLKAERQALFERADEAYLKRTGEHLTLVVAATKSGYSTKQVRRYLDAVTLGGRSSLDIEEALKRLVEGEPSTEAADMSGTCPVVPIALLQKPNENAGDDGQKQGFSTQAQTRAALTKTAGRA